MTDFEGLERLQRLRADGAITDEEFATAKARLLSPNKVGISFPAMAGLAAVLILAAALVYWVIQTGASPSATESENATSFNGNVSAQNDVVEEPRAPNDPKALYRWATSPKVIGLNPDYLEKRLGVPREKSGGFWTFDVASCPIFYWVKGSEILSFSAPVTEQCQPNGVTHRTTFGNVLAKASHGQYFADCISNCGNAADPDIELLYPGARVNGFIDESFSSTSLLGANGDPFELWTREVRRARGVPEDDFSSDPEAFSCVSNPSARVAASLRNAKIQMVRIGRDLHANCS